MAKNEKSLVSINPSKPRYKIDPNSGFVNFSYLPTSNECELIESLAELDKGGVINTKFFEEYIENKLFNLYKGSETLFIKNKYLYMFTEGAINYLEAFESMRSDNATFIDHEITELTSILEKVITEHDKKYAIVSIGAATSRKEIESIYSGWRKFDFEKLSYFPIDVSPYLLQIGALEFKQELNDMDININPILSDLWNLSKFSENNYNDLPFSEYDKKIFSFLGGTIGNYQEDLILNEIIKLMNKGDLLVIGLEIQKRSLKDKDFKQSLLEKYSTYSNLNFLLEPLYHIPKLRGYIHKPGKYLNLNKHAYFDGTTRHKNPDYDLITKVPNSICYAPSVTVPGVIKEIGDSSNKKISLAHSTKYECDAFKRWIGDEYGDAFSIASEPEESDPVENFGFAVIELERISDRDIPEGPK